MSRPLPLLAGLILGAFATLAMSGTSPDTSLSSRQAMGSPESRLEDSHRLRHERN